MFSSRSLATTLGFIGLLAAAQARAQVQSACGDLLVVLDRSGSMSNCRINGATKESIAKSALQRVIQQFPGVPMGLFVFPGDMGGGACAPGREAVPMSRTGATAIQQYLVRMNSSGGTPTGSTMQIVKGYERWTAGHKHYVILLTDGQPTCDDGDDGGRLMGGMCVGGGPGIPCNGGGSCECRNPTKLFDAVAEMAGKEIHTFVIGFEGMGTGTGCNGASGSMRPFNPDTLNRAAELGLEPNRTGATKYYSATDPVSLEAALKRIVTTIARGGDPEFLPVSPCDQGGEGATPGGGSGDGGAGRPLPSTFPPAPGGSGSGGSGSSGSSDQPTIDGGGCSCSLRGKPAAGPIPLLAGSLVVAALRAVRRRAPRRDRRRPSRPRS